MKKLIHFTKDVFTYWRNSDWIPFLTALITFPIFVLSTYLTDIIPNKNIRPFLYNYVGSILFIGAVLTVIAYLFHIIISFIDKKFKRTILEILGICVIFVSIAITSFLYLVYSFFFIQEDDFAKDLIIPSDVQYQIPLDYLIDDENYTTSNKSSFQHQLMSALNDKSIDTRNYKMYIPSLEKLSKENLNLLKRYLASSSEWNLTIDSKKLQARHRWQINNNAHPTLHNNLVVVHNNSSKHYMQYHCYLNFGSFNFYDSHNANNPKIENELFSLHSSYPIGNLTLEIFEQNKIKQPSLTAKTFELLESEFSKILQCKNFEEIRKLLPPNSVKNGKPDITLRKSFQGGIYDAEIWVNPKRAGYIYLKAYEVTKNYRLSEHRLKQRTSEYIGWSDNPNEVFSSFTHFTIYEGDWGLFYLARFEVWFVPEDGTPEEKLLEKTFKIEGWMR